VGHTVALIERAGLSGQPLRVIDMGCGTAQIPIRLAPRLAGSLITAVDLAGSMLRVGEGNVARAGLGDRVTLALQDCKSLSFPDGAFDVVVSNSLLHHVPDPAQPLREAVRVLRPGGVLFFRDLCRPDSAEEVEDIVSRYAAEADAHQRDLFRASLHPLGRARAGARLPQLGPPRHHRARALVPLARTQIPNSRRGATASETRRAAGLTGPLRAHRRCAKAETGTLGA